MITLYRIKEILNLLKSEEGTIKVNEICYLSRWTRDCLGNKVDGLKLEFYTINNVRHSIYPTTIISRQWNEIVEEIEKLNKLFLEELQMTLCKNIRTGYWDKGEAYK